VTDDMLEVPESIAVFVLMLLCVLLNVVHQLIVGKDLFVVIIIDSCRKSSCSCSPICLQISSSLITLRIHARCRCPSSLSMRKVRPISSEGSMTGIGGKISHHPPSHDET
jgi:hypothetical protein